MKFIAAFFIGLCIVGLMAGCSTIQPQSAQAQVAQICANLSAVSAAFESTPGALSDADKAKLAEAKPIVAKVCAASVPAKPDLQSVAAVAVPVLLDVVQASTLPGQTKLQISLGVNIAKAVIAQQLAEDAAEASAAK